MQTSFLLQIIGWCAPLLLIIAYSLVTLEKIKPTSYLVHLLNFAGALILGILVWKSRNWQVLVVELFWCSIALIGLAKRILNKSQTNKNQ